MDRKTVIKPTVVDKVEQLRQIRHLLNKQDVSSSEEDSEHQQRSLSLSFGKHVDFVKCKSLPSCYLPIFHLSNRCSNFVFTFRLAKSIA